MKTPLIVGLLATSLVANAMLLRSLTRPQVAPGFVESRRTDGGRAALESTDPFVPAWEQLNSADPAQLVNQLRTAGLPPKMSAAITQAVIFDQFAERRRAILAATPSAYWSRDYFQSFSGGAAMRELTREQRRAFQAVMGEDWESTLMSAAAKAERERTYGPIPIEKISRIMEISSDYSELRSAVQTESGGLLLAEDRAKLALLAQEERADLQALLTPEEYEDYQLRRSPAANQLRSQLTWVEVNEQEFRSLYRLQEAYNDQFNSMTAPSSPSANAAQRRAAEQALIAEAKTILGEERGTEFERSRDASYRQLAALVDRLELPRATAQEVTAVQRDIQRRWAAVQTNSALTPDERRSQSSTLAREATESITRSLGPDGFSAYRQSAGFWLNTMEQRPGAQPAPGTLIQIRP